MHRGREVSTILNNVRLIDGIGHIWCPRTIKVEGDWIWVEQREECLTRKCQNGHSLAVFPLVPSNIPVASSTVGKLPDTVDIGNQ